MSILTYQTYAGKNTPLFRASGDSGPQQPIAIRTLSFLPAVLDSTENIYCIGSVTIPEPVSNVFIKGWMSYSNPYTSPIVVNLYLTTNADGTSSEPSGTRSTSLTGITLTGTGTYISLMGLSISNLSVPTVYLGMTVTSGLPPAGSLGANLYLAPASWTVPVGGQWTVGYGAYAPTAGGAVMCIST